MLFFYYFCKKNFVVLKKIYLCENIEALWRVTGTSTLHKSIKVFRSPIKV